MPQPVVDLNTISTMAALAYLFSKTQMRSKERTNPEETNVLPSSRDAAAPLCCRTAVALFATGGVWRAFYLCIMIIPQVLLHNDKWCWLSAPLLTCALLYSQPAVLEVGNKTVFAFKDTNIVQVCDRTRNIPMAFSRLPKT